MFLDKEKLNEVIKLIKKSLLKKDERYQTTRFSFFSNLCSSILLGILLVILPAYITKTLFKIFLGSTILLSVVSGGLLLCRLIWAKQYSRILAIKYSLEYDNYDELINDIKNDLQIDRKDLMDNKVEYTKDGKPIIDVDYEEVPESLSQDESTDFITESIPETSVIDVDYIPVEDVPLEQNILYLRDYVNEVAYDGYEKDLAIIDAMYELVVSGTVTGPVLTSIEDSLHILVESIFSKACEHYGLPNTRKRTNPNT